jgi:protein SCO1/2
MRCLGLFALLTILHVGGSQTIVNQGLPEDLEAAQIDEQLGAQIPLDLPFVDMQGEPVQLQQYWQTGRPVILSLNYYRCPMLCTLVLNGLTEAIQELDLTLGQDYEVVTVSFDHNEGPELARAKHQRYVEALGMEEGKTHWHFLVGPEESITTLCETVGFGFSWVPPTSDEELGQFAHQAAIFITTPEGVVSRCLFGIQFDPETLRLSLVEASEGQVGSTLDRIILYCYHFDPRKGAYAPVAVRIMQAGGGATAVVLVLLLLTFWLRDLRRVRRRQEAQEAA